MNATFAIWKPINIGSFDVVRIAKTSIGSFKIGHAGSLDPFAEGILVLCIGKKTKEVPRIMAMKKEYIGKIKLGLETETLDKTGLITRKSPPPTLNTEIITSIFKEFTGDIEQTPPAFSALKFCGRSLYQYARAGIRIIKKPRIVTIYSLDFIEYKDDVITFRVLCGSGTYIRSLASDISKKLNTYGYLDELKRIRVGNFTKENCLSLEQLRDGNIN